MSAQQIGSAAWAALVVLQFAWYLWLAPPAGGSGWIALALTVPPLLLPLLALRANPRRALLWVGILALFYFCHGIAAAWTAPYARAPALLEVALCLVLICTLGWDARHYRRNRTRSV